MKKSFQGMLILFISLIVILGGCIPEAGLPQTSSHPVINPYTARTHDVIFADTPEPSLTPEPVFTPGTAREPEPLQIKILGDSITAGGKCTGYSPDGGQIVKGKKASETGYCYANLLKGYFKNDTVKNWGISGFTSGDILKNIPQLVEREDDVVLLMIGVNDCCKNIEDEFEENMEAIIGYITDQGKELIIITCSPVTRPKIRHLEDVVDIQRQLAFEYDLQCIDVYQNFLDYCGENNTAVDSLLADGLHPDDEGQKVIYDIIISNIDL